MRELLAAFGALGVVTFGCFLLLVGYSIAIGNWLAATGYLTASFWLLTAALLEARGARWKALLDRAMALLGEDAPK